MAEITGQAGEIRFAIEIKRAATGEVETHELIGKVMTDGSDPFGGSASSGD